MNRRLLIVVSTTFFIMSLTLAIVFAISETEPNDTPAQANTLPAGQTVDGAVDPVGDLDYYAMDGVNPSWGFIALLQTDNSAASQDATLTAIGSDGATVLQQDAGSWAHGSGIALQPYEGAADQYLQVRESGDDAQVTTYGLRHYPTVISTQPEVEPNETGASGTPSSFTHAGVLTTAGDRDCYAFEGRDGDTILLAVNGDPEDDGSVADPILELEDTDGATLASANHSGVSGNEFLEYGPLPGNGAYAYCVSNAAAGDAAATYHAGIVRNGGLYFTSYKQQPIWLNRPANGMAHIGDALTFRVAVTNTSPIPIPGHIDLQANFDAACLGFTSATIAPSDSAEGLLWWTGLKPDGLSPGERYSVDVQMEALAPCSDDFYQGTYVDYFFTGSASITPYSIGLPQYLPAVFRP